MPARLLSPAILVIALAQSGGTAPAERAHSQAVRLLGEGDNAGAEAAARSALSKSSYFEPEKEIRETPEKGVLFEDMIEKARTAYRARRARYFATLGNALVAQERWAEGRKALRRSVTLVPSSEALLGMASHPDLDVAQRIALLLDAYFAPDADEAAVERSLLETGAFADREVLRAVFDRERFALELAEEFPEIKVLVEPLPDIRVAATRSTFVSSEYLDEGMTVVLYFPKEGCPRCSEELDAIGGAVLEWSKQGHEFAVGAFVKEQELTSVRRIVRLLSMSIEVGRVDRLPRGIEPADDGEVWIVSRHGLMQIRIPLAGDLLGNQIRDQVTAALRLLGPPEEKESGKTPRRTRPAEKTFSTLVDEAAALEAGPVPIPDRYQQIDLALRRILRDAADESHVWSALEELARLRGAGAAKSRAFLSLDRELPKRLLAAVKEVAPEIDVQATPEQGVFYLGVAEVGGQKTILLQRTFFGRLLPQNFDFILRIEEGNSSVAWMRPQPDQPQGARAISGGAVFFFEGEDCRGLRLVDIAAPSESGPLYEGCPAKLEGEGIIEVKEVLLDAAPAGLAPVFYRRGKIEGSELIAPESPLEEGKRLFEEGRYRQALSAFQQSAKNIDPMAPYDEVDLRYNIARCYEELGQRSRALEIMESIGDAAYQALVDKKLGELEVATRR